MKIDAEFISTCDHRVSTHKQAGLTYLVKIRLVIQVKQ